MPRPSTGAHSPTAAERAAMHMRYRQGGGSRRIAPHVVYSEASCPHPGCDHPMQAIDFRLEDHGRAVHVSLVTAWWNDTGFAGRCPNCEEWIHFTILDKRVISVEAASRLPTLPEDWYAVAAIL